MDETVSRVCCGVLPADAPLANPYVPFQSDAATQYTAKTGLIRGTLFPCLNLPFMGMVNTEEKSDTMMHQLQALSFAIQELGLYLTTHANDREVLELYWSYIRLGKQGREKYVEQYGPLCVTDLTPGSFQWLNDPWPWDLGGND